MKTIGRSFFALLVVMVLALGLVQTSAKADEDYHCYVQCYKTYPYTCIASNLPCFTEGVGCGGRHDINCNIYYSWGCDECP